MGRRASIRGMGNEPTDRELLARAGDPQAFALFYRRHVDRLVRFAARRVSDPADAADVAAATFVVALRGSGALRPTARRARSVADRHCRPPHCQRPTAESPRGARPGEA